MYLLFAPQGHLRERITRLLGSRFDLILAKSWDELEQRTVEATCTLIAIDRFDNWIQRERLHVFRERHHVRPLIVVTQGDAYNIRHLQNIPVNATIFLSELDKKLPEAIRYHCSADFLKRLAESFKKEARLPATLREALVYLLASDRPPRSVGELAGIIGCDPTTLNRQVRRVLDPDTSLTMKDVIDWVLLLQAVLRKGPKDSWVVIAAAFGIHAHTLSRISKRLVDRPIGRVRATDQEALVRQFVADVVEPFTSICSPNLQFIGS